MQAVSHATILSNRRQLKQSKNWGSERVECSVNDQRERKIAGKKLLHPAIRSYIYIGNRRTRIAKLLTEITAPACKSSPHRAITSANRSLMMLGFSLFILKRMILGNFSPLTAMRSPKSRSSVSRIRSSTRAVRRMSESGACCIFRSRTCKTS